MEIDGFICGDCGSTDCAGARYVPNTRMIFCDCEECSETTMMFTQGMM
jgi:hypothetical protein